jgi:small subunit ribosomal protein S17e
LNRIRKLAEELFAKYPARFSTNFEANKKALDDVAIIRNRALRNQIAGAIATLAAENAPESEAPAEGGVIEAEPIVEVTNNEPLSQEAQ